MIYLSKSQIISLHDRLIALFGGTTGIRNSDLLDLSINSIHQTFEGKDLYPTVVHKAVHLAFSLITNHAFLDGNKRIGTHAMLVLFALNGYRLDYTDEELIAIVMAVAAGQKSENDLFDWVKERLKADGFNFG